MAIKDSGPLTDFDRLTLHQAVIIVALELLRGRVAGDTERRLAGDVLAAVVGGDLAGPELDPAAGAVRPRRAGSPRSPCRPRRRPRSRPAPVEDALAAALREEASPGWSPRPDR